MIPTKEMPETISLFDMTSIHKMYWKGFCDVCLPRLGNPWIFSDVMTNEQKYEAFCRSGRNINNTAAYKEELLSPLKITVERLERIRVFFNEVEKAKDTDPVLSSLLHLQRALESLERDVDVDCQLIKYMQPRDSLFDAVKEVPEDCHLAYDDKVKVKELKGINASIIDQFAYGIYQRDETWTHIFDGLTGEGYDEDGLPNTVPLPEGHVSELVWGIWRYFARWYNDIVCRLKKVQCPFLKTSDNGPSSFVYRLFMTYQSSLPDIVNLINGTAPQALENKLTQLRKDLMDDFCDSGKSKLGSEWMQNMVKPEHIKFMDYHLLNDRATIGEEDERQFFYTLDKICIITDILNGNARKYGLDVMLPQEGLLEQRVTSSVSNFPSATAIATTEPHTKDGGRLSDEKLKQKIDSVRHLIKCGRDWFPILCVLMEHHYLSSGDFTGGVTLLERFYGEDKTFHKPDAHDMMSKLYTRPFNEELKEWERYEALDRFEEKRLKKYLSIAEAFDQLFEP